MALGGHNGKVQNKCFTSKATKIRLLNGVKFQSTLLRKSKTTNKVGEKVAKVFSISNQTMYAALYTLQELGTYYKFSNLHIG